MTLNLLIWRSLVRIASCTTHCSLDNWITFTEKNSWPPCVQALFLFENTYQETLLINDSKRWFQKQFLISCFESRKSWFFGSLPISGHVLDNSICNLQISFTHDFSPTHNLYVLSWKLGVPLWDKKNDQVFKIDPRCAVG